jgi:hypothetical protein
VPKAMTSNSKAEGSARCRGGYFIPAGERLAYHYTNREFIYRTGPDL